MSDPQLVDPRGLWFKTAPEAPDITPLSEDISCDLAIVGGGYTGCSAALEAASLGARVVHCEADSIGHGGSGRNVGLVNAGLWLPPEALAKAMGAEPAQRLTDALAGAPDMVFDLIERHGIACEARQAGTLHCAHNTAAVRGLHDRGRQLQAQGVQVLDAAEARRRVGSEQVHGALFDARAGTIQPLGYVRGLAAAGMKNGAQLFEKTPVSRIDRRGDNWRLTANGCEITAHAILIATNAYHRDIPGMVVPRVARVNYFQCATAPVSDNLAGNILPSGEGCWDTGLVMSSWRKDTAGRLILGGMGAPTGMGRAVHLGWARRKLARMYPQIGDMPFEHHWHGEIAMTRDHVPKLFKIGPQGVAIFGYSGRGIAPGTLLGRAAARHLLGLEEPLPIDPISRYAERGVEVRTWVYESAARIMHALRR